MKTKYKQEGTFIRLTKEEKDILGVLKNKHFINISAMVRQAIRDIYSKLEDNAKRVEGDENNQIK